MKSQADAETPRWTCTFWEPLTRGLFFLGMAAWLLTTLGLARHLFRLGLQRCVAGAQLCVLAKSYVIRQAQQLLYWMGPLGLRSST